MIDFSEEDDLSSIIPLDVLLDLLNFLLKEGLEYIKDSKMDKIIITEGLTNTYIDILGDI